MTKKLEAKIVTLIGLVAIYLIVFLVSTGWIHPEDGVMLFVVFFIVMVTIQTILCRNSHCPYPDDLPI